VGLEAVNMVGQLWDSSLTLPIITASLTFAGGVILFIISQLLSRFIFDPLSDLRRTMADVAYTLMLHRNLLMNAKSVRTDLLLAAQVEIRPVASRLATFTRAIPFHHWFAARGWVPCRRQISEAVSSLIGVSNATPSTPPDDIRSDIEAILRLVGMSD
jgi:hypothetical protein